MGPLMISGGCPAEETSETRASSRSLRALQSLPLAAQAQSTSAQGDSGRNRNASQEPNESYV